MQIQIDSPVTVTDAVNGGYTASGNLPPNIRKYVLSQPDVCLPTLAPLDGTYSHGSTGTSSGASDKRREDYVKYNGALWDGFTIRHGFPGRRRRSVRFLLIRADRERQKIRAAGAGSLQVRGRLRRCDGDGANGAPAGSPRLGACDCIGAS